jgi:hypothetical protein
MVLPPEARPQLSRNEWNLVFDLVDTTYAGSSKVYSRINAMQALRDLRDGVILRPYQLKILENMAKDSAVPEAKALAEAAKQQLPPRDRFIGAIASFPKGLSEAMRTLWASGDISYAFRQLRPALNRDIANFLTLRPSATWAKSVGKGIEAFISENKFTEFQQTYQQGKSYEMLRDYGQIVEPGDVPGRVIEEGFVSKAVPKIPVIGSLVKASNRAAIVMGNATRVAVADELLLQYERAGITITPAIERRIATSVGNLTGRALLPRYQSLQRTYNFLNDVLFSPRFLLSRVENAATGYGTVNALIAADPVMIKEGIKRLAGAIVTTTTVAMIAKMYGADVETDMRSSDFLKAHYKNTHVDLTEGIGQIYRFFARMATGTTLNASGHSEKINRKEEILKFFQTKEAPLIGFITSLYFGTDFAGNKIRGTEAWAKQAGKNFIFGWVNDTIDAVADEMDKKGLQKAAVDALPVAAMGLTGIGVQTFPPSARTLDTQMKDKLAREAYGKDWQDLAMSQQETLSMRNEKAFAQSELAIQKEGASRDNTNAAERAERAAQEAGANVVAKLPPAAQEQIKALGIVIRLDQKIGSWKLNDQRFDTYQQMVADELARQMPPIIKSPRWARTPEIERREILSDLIADAKGEADFQIEDMAERARRRKGK